uniref:Uncharacterized protein n=1 Tax=Mus musculus TaxID=10090 RepID=Q3U0A3_MOUSE|nr:unnamed protein product [Mus musculus]
MDGLLKLESRYLNPTHPPLREFRQVISPRQIPCCCLSKEDGDSATGLLALVVAHTIFLVAAGVE